MEDDRSNADDGARRAGDFRREADRARRFASEQTNVEIQTVLTLYAEELEAAAEEVEKDPSCDGPRKSPYAQRAASRTVD